MAAPQLNDDATYGWAYAPPSHLEGEPAVPIPAEPPGLEIPANRATRLPSGVVAYRETVGHHNRMQELDRQAQAAKMARDQAAQDARMLDQMMRVARSTKDIAEAQQFIALRRLEQDIRNGMAPHQALLRNPMATGSGFGSALRATTPDAAPTKLEMPGMPPAIMANGRPYWPPASAMPAEPLSTTGVTLRDEQGNPMGTGFSTGPRSRTVIRTPSAGSLTETESAENQLLMQKRRSLENQLDSIISFRGDQPKSAYNPQYQSLTNQLGQIDAILQKRLPGAFPSGTSAPAKATPQKPVAVLGQGTRSDPARPISKEQFNLLPSGAFFINPSDGKLRQKK